MTGPARRALAAALVALPGLALGTWRSEGPFLAAVTDVAVDPSKPETIYAATSSGGVWRSDDAGKTWTLPGNGMTSRNVLWIEVDPKTPSTLWAGVEATGRPGFWRSTDRGKSWSLVRMDATSHAVGQRIAFAPSKRGLVFVPSTNLHYRTADGGKTWASFRVPNQDAYAFAFDPANADVVWAGGRGEERHLSRSRDGGKSWKAIGEGLPENSVKALRVAPTSPATLYAVVGFGRLFRSADAGETFEELELGLGGTDELYALAVDPLEPKRLLAATRKGLFATEDGGDSWGAAGDGTGGFLVKALAFHPAKEGVVYAGAAGDGLFASADGGRTFEPLGTGLAAGWTERLWASPDGTGPVFAQTGAGLFRRDGPESWTQLREPFSDGGPAKVDGFLFDRSSPKRIWAHRSSSWWRSEDAGRSWSRVEVKGPGMKEMLKGKLAEPQFRSLAQDPGDPKVLYAGSWSSREPGTAVFRTTDGGKKWQPAGTGIAASKVDLLRAVSPGTLFAACGDDGLFRTTDGGKSWSRVRPGEVKDVAIDPKEPSRLFAATKKGLFRSADDGATWSRVSQGLKEDEIEAVVVGPDGTAWAGAFDGVFRSADGGTTWQPASEGLANTDVRALAISGGSAPRLWAGLAGGSVVSTELP